MKEKVFKPEELNQFLETFPNFFKTIILASIDDNDFPYCSYAPFVRLENDFYILISRTAPHFNFINKGKVGAMIIDDEKDSSNKFFRKRIHLTCFSNMVDKNNEELVKKFKEVHGEFVTMLLKMDFEFFKLSLKEAKLVTGAGEAYFVDANMKVVDQDYGSKNKKENK